MAEALPYKSEKLFIGVLYSDNTIVEEVYSQLETLWGPIERRSEPIPFLFTDYYNEEMRVTPTRQFLLFQKLIDPSLLAQCKIETNKIEEMWATDQRRRINLDPGLISAENIILATTKNRGHRIPLHSGIYGEVTLLYTNKGYIDFQWTYPDYKERRSKEFFLSARKEYLAQLQKEMKQ